MTLPHRPPFLRNPFTGWRPVARTALLGIAFSLVSLDAAPVLADRVPRVSADESGRRPPALRERWFLRPSDPGAAEATLFLPTAKVVARLGGSDGRWILEADADSAARVEQRFAPLGELVGDRRGRPALLESTARVGVRDAVWSGLDLRGDPHLTVAILDSGCDTAHDDLGDPDRDNEGAQLPPGDVDDWIDGTAGLPASPEVRVIAWHDVTDDEPLAEGPWDFHLHGTALASAGFGGGRLDPDRRGVAPEAPLAIVKTWNFEGRWEIWASDLLLGLQWVFDNADRYRIGAVLIGATWDAELGMETMITTLLDRGIAVVAPAGNDPSAELGWPARIEGVLAVGACTDDGRLASYSTPGRAGVADSGLDLLAPGGSEIQLDDTIVVADNEPDDTYRGRVGTSLAAAHVAGAVNLVAQALDESGRSWRRERGQVDWLVDLLRITASESEGAEVGAAGLPRDDRVGPDRFEGFGILRVDAAIEAVERVVWPGEALSFDLAGITSGAPVAAARVPRLGTQALRFQLVPPADADFDLFVYLEREDGLQRLGWSSRRGPGLPEIVEAGAGRAGWLICVVKRASGAGTGVLEILEGETGAGAWPVQTDRDLSDSPTALDLDGDGTLELVAVANVLDEQSHRIWAFDAAGQRVAGFPAVVFSSNQRPGELRTPVRLRRTATDRLVATSDFGEVFAVGVDASPGFALQLTPGQSLGGAAVWRPTAVPERAVFGTSRGLAAVDAEGAVVFDLDLGAAVTSAPAVGDLDGDGEEEVVVVDALARMHRLDRQGTEAPGWPVVLASSLGAPLLLGDGSGAGAQRIVVAESSATGPRVRVFGADGTDLSAGGFELFGGQSVLATSPPSASPSGSTTSVEILLAALLAPADGSFRLALARVEPTTGAVRETSLFVTAPAFAAGLLLPNRPWLATPLTLPLRSSPGAEVLVRARVGWIEVGGVARNRYGSMHALLLHGDGLLGVADRPSLDGGHRAVLDARRIEPIAVDLEGDGSVELIVGSGRTLYRLHSPVRGSLDGLWPRPRADEAATACSGCGFEGVVQAPLPPRAQRLRVAPNPFNPRTEAWLDAPVEGGVEWALFDLRGRRLRVWTGPGGPAPRTVVEARDAQGRPLASGSYLLRARFSGGEIATRLTLVR